MGVAILGLFPTTTLWPFSGIACGYLLSHLLSNEGRRQFQQRKAATAESITSSIFPPSAPQQAWNYLVLIPVAAVIGFVVWQKLPTKIDLPYADGRLAAADVQKPSFRDPFTRRLADLKNTQIVVLDDSLHVKTRRQDRDRVKQLLQWQGPVTIRSPQCNESFALDASDFLESDVDGDDELEVRLSQAGQEKVSKALEGKPERLLLIEIDDQLFGQYKVGEKLDGWQRIDKVRDVQLLDVLMHTPPLPTHVGDEEP
jgi:hypothetical protein